MRTTSRMVLVFGLALVGAFAARETAADDDSPASLLSRRCSELPATPQSLETWLAHVARQIHVPIRFDRESAATAGVAVDRAVALSPEPRSAAEVLRDLLGAADPERKLSLTAHSDDVGRYEFQLTSTVAAQRRGDLMIPREIATSEPSNFVDQLLQRRCRDVQLDRVDLRAAVEQVAQEIGATIHIEANALRREGITQNQSFLLYQRRETAALRLHAIFRQADPGGRLCVVVAAPDAKIPELIVTTRWTAAVSRRPLHELVEPAAPKKPPSIKPQLRRLSLSLRGNTLEGTLLLAARDLNGVLRLDEPACRALGVSLHQRIDVEIINLAPSRAVAAIVDRARPAGLLTGAVFFDAAERPHIVVTSRAEFQRRGADLQLSDFESIPPQTPPAYRDSLLQPTWWVNRALSKPIDGEAQETTREDALERIATAMNLPIEINRFDLKSAGFDVRALVTFNPRQREARAVLFDLLNQADPLRELRLVACIERRADEFALLVISREGAVAAGRSILFDYMLTSDDQPAR